jgi:hypothetical protein
VEVIIYTRGNKQHNNNAQQTHSETTIDRLHTPGYLDRTTNFPINTFGAHYSPHVTDGKTTDSSASVPPPQQHNNVHTQSPATWRDAKTLDERNGAGGAAGGQHTVTMQLVGGSSHGQQDTPTQSLGSSSVHSVEIEESGLIKTIIPEGRAACYAFFSSAPSDPTIVMLPSLS